MEVWCGNGKHYTLPKDVSEEKIKDLVKADYPNPLLIKRTETKYYVLHKNI